MNTKTLLSLAGLALAASAHAQTAYALPFTHGIQSPQRTAIERWIDDCEALEATSTGSEQAFWHNAAFAFYDCETILGLHGPGQLALASMRIDQGLIASQAGAEDDERNGALLGYQTAERICAIPGRGRPMQPKGIQP